LGVVELGGGVLACFWAMVDMKKYVFHGDFIKHYGLMGVISWKFMVIEDDLVKNQWIFKMI